MKKSCDEVLAAVHLRVLPKAGHSNLACRLRTRFAQMETPSESIWHQRIGFSCQVEASLIEVKAYRRVFGSVRDVIFIKRDKRMSIGEDAAQLVVAVFDDWDTLQTVLEDMVKANELTSSGALLHVCKDVPPPLHASGSFRSVTELRFGTSSVYVTCMGGGIAEQLAVSSAQGERTLADALCNWLTPNKRGSCRAISKRGTWCSSSSSRSSMTLVRCAHAWCARARTS